MTIRSRIKGLAISAFLEAPIGAIREQVEELRGGRGGARPTTLYYQVDDPFSHLLAQAARRLLDVPGAAWELAVVRPPGAEIVADPERRRAWAVRDARELARYFDVDFPAAGDASPSPEIERVAQGILCAPRPAAEAFDAAVEVGDAVWRGDERALADAERRWGAVGRSEVDALLDAHGAALRQRGHFHGGVVYHGGEFYWGLDRLSYLEHALGAPSPAVRFRPLADRPDPGPLPEQDGEIVLDMYFSFRSPYSYIAAHRLRELAEREPVRVRVKPVLPMVMRGIEVPRAKAMYIARDAKREADRENIPFGRVCDPVGRGVQRCMAVFEAADAAGRGLDFCAEAGRGIWSEALDMTDDGDLRRVVERAGVAWDEAEAALDDDVWKQRGAAHREELYALGLWGVPSFRLGDYVAWGQDRIWILVDRIRRH